MASTRGKMGRQVGGEIQEEGDRNADLSPTYLTLVFEALLAISLKI